MTPDDEAPAAAVDAYIAALPDASRPAVEHLRATIRAAAPGATETISYQMPAFRAEGRMLVWYAAFARHCSVFPATERVVEALGDEVRPYLAGRGTIRFPLGRPLPLALVTRIVEVRLAENRAAARPRQSARRSRPDR
jgi:uncharacterized protein YdhG (YjbR/CyaY superfamily)